jgi:carbonic anhydrase/acetyltransferase-like protein (isoleucine patch superfamily)
MQISLGGRHPRIHPSAWIAPNATVIGDVTMAQRSSLWYSAVIRADSDSITVGQDSNIQDGCVLHSDPGHPLVIGAGVTVGHGARLHGCQIDDDVLIGIGTTILNGTSIGRGSILGAGTVLPEGVAIPPCSLVVGVPGKVRRMINTDELEAIRSNALRYIDRITDHRANERSSVQSDTRTR